MKQDLEVVAKSIIDSILYMTLGTADENGEPWVSPVYFSSAVYREFYWISSPDARHSRNILVHPAISIVVFDSRVPAGTGQAVYMSAIAEQVPESDLGRGLSVYNGRFQKPADHGVRAVLRETVSGVGLYRLYRAIAREAWVLNPQSHPDRRIPVDLAV